MGGIGHEGRQAVAGLGQAAEHGVERAGEIADLVGGVGFGQTLVDVGDGDLPGRGGHRCHRGQRPAHEAPGEQPDEDEEQRHTDRQGPQQGPGGLVGPVERPADQDRRRSVGGGDAHHDEAVLADRGVVDDRGRLVVQIGDGREPVDVGAGGHDGPVAGHDLDEGVLLVLDGEIGGRRAAGLQGGGHVLGPQLGGLPHVAGQRGPGEEHHGHRPGHQGGAHHEDGADRGRGSAERSPSATVLGRADSRRPARSRWRTARRAGPACCAGGGCRPRRCSGRPRTRRPRRCPGCPAWRPPCRRGPGGTRAGRSPGR